MSFQNGIINNLIENKIEIFFPDGDAQTITEENIASESLTLKQSICDSEALTFGGCIASELSIKLINTNERSFSTAELVGKWISVKITQFYADPDVPVYPSGTIYPSDELYPGKSTGSKEFYIFSGFIKSAAVSKTDKNEFSVTAYDVLAKLNETDATDELFALLKGGAYPGQVYAMCIDNNTKVTVARDDSYAVLKGREPISLESYNITNEQWRSRKDKISYGKILKNLCEMLGVFGVIVPNSAKGFFSMKTLTGNSETYAFYENLYTEEFEATGYTDYKFTVTGNEKTGKTAGGGLSDLVDTSVEKVYDFSPNILISLPYVPDGQGRYNTFFDNWMNSTNVGARIAMNAEKGVCALTTYQPLSATLDGRLWVNVGSPIEILVNKTTVDGDYVLDENGNIIKEPVKTYVLSRTLSGIQALTDTLEIKGVR